MNWFLFAGSTAAQSALLPAEDIIQMESLPGDRQLFIIHPIEGDVAHLRELASRLPGRVFGLQCTRNTPTDTIPDMASYYLQVKTITHIGLVSFCLHQNFLTDID